MNKVFCFSGSGNSLKIAQYMQKRLQCDLLDLTSYKTRQAYQKEAIEVAVIVAPIYGQALIDPVIEMFQMIQAKAYCLLFTYGKMGTGHVIQDSLKYIQGDIIAAALIPTNHSYYEVGEFVDYDKLDVIINKMENKDYSRIKIEHLSRSLFAGIFPKLRTQMNVSIKRNQPLCNSCGICQDVCPTQAMFDGLVNSECIRCLKCVHSCPTKALTFHVHPLLSLYLSKIKDDKLYLYLD